MVTLPPGLVSTDFGTCSYQFIIIIIIIYTFIFETNHVSTVYSVTAIL